MATEETDTTQTPEQPAEAGGEETPHVIPDGNKTVAELFGDDGDGGKVEAEAKPDTEDKTGDEGGEGDEGDDVLERIAKGLEAASVPAPAAKPDAAAPVKLSERYTKILTKQAELFGEDSEEYTQLKAELEESQREIDGERAEIAPIRERAAAEQKAKAEQVVKDVSAFFEEKAKAGYGDVFNWKQAQANAAKGIRHPVIDMAINIQDSMVRAGRTCTEREALTAATEILLKDHPTTKAAKAKVAKATKLSDQTATPPVRAGGAAAPAKGDPWAKAKAGLAALGIPD